MYILDKIFDDKRVASVVLMIWLLFVIILLSYLDVLHSHFMTVGPSSHTKFMTVSIDTWHKWCLLTGATFANTCITDFMSDAITPWIQNTIQDHKTKYLPYSKLTAYFIVQSWCIYCNVMSIFAISLITSQIDFLFIRLLADLSTSTFTTFKFMRHKMVDEVKYNFWNEEKLKEADNPGQLLQEFE